MVSQRSIAHFLFDLVDPLYGSAGAENLVFVNSHRKNSVRAWSSRVSIGRWAYPDLTKALGYFAFDWSPQHDKWIRNWDLGG